MYKEGELHGTANEYAADGFLCAKWEYNMGERCGSATIYLRDGGRLVGGVNESGVVDGDATYYYPDDTQLVGQWKEGKMVSARYLRPGSTLSTETYQFDQSTSTVISCSSLLADPYESDRVFVQDSSLPNAGEGLFAKRKIHQDEVVSFYNGIRLTHQEVDGRSWKFNNNTITLDDDTVIDVPPAFSSLDHYCASLAHKSNHHFPGNNAVYDLYDHPRFGLIKCIRAITDIEAGSEITVLYGYEDSFDRQPDGSFEAPDWYREQLQQSSVA